MHKNPLNVYFQLHREIPDFWMMQVKEKLWRDTGTLKNPVSKINFS